MTIPPASRRKCLRSLGVGLRANKDSKPRSMRKPASLVYVCAFMTPPDQSANDVSQHAVMAAGMAPSVFCADADAVGAMRINPASEEAAYRARLTETFFSATRRAPRPHASSRRSIATSPSVWRASLRRRPSAGSAASRATTFTVSDRAIPPAAQDFMIASVDSALGSKTHVQTLWASHSPFLSQPDKLAAALIAATA